MMRATHFLAAFAAILIVSATTRAEWQNSTWVNTRPYERFGSSSQYHRPGAADQKVLCVYDWRISRLPRNHKGIEVGVKRLGNGTAWAYRWIGIWHCEISDAWRDTGMHTDFIRIFGGGSDRQDVPTTVILEDIYIHDGNALPVIIQDGQFDRIVLKDLRIENTANSIQLVTMNSGSMGEIHVVNSPGLRVTICGRPGSVGTCYVKNSPGAVVRDSLNKTGYSGVKIVYVD